jgi:hypothetical protein
MVVIAVSVDSLSDREVLEYVVFEGSRCSGSRVLGVARLRWGVHAGPIKGSIERV